MARYGSGEYFGPHHDAFPTEVALEKGYQRIATLLLYLNDVGEGGETVFGCLKAGGEMDGGGGTGARLTDGPGLGFRPKRGDGILFFPCGLGGDVSPDEYTVHEALPAIDEKWVSQVWISVGIAAAPAAATGTSSGKPMSKAARRRMEKARTKKR